MVVFLLLLLQNFSCFFLNRSVFLYVSRTIKGNQTLKAHSMVMPSLCACVSLNPYLCAFDSMKYGEQIVVFMYKIMNFVLFIMKLSILNNFQKTIICIGVNQNFSKLIRFFTWNWFNLILWNIIDSIQFDLCVKLMNELSEITQYFFFVSISFDHNFFFF